jgi:uncharacterized protein (TIGR02246 family)
MQNDEQAIRDLIAQWNAATAVDDVETVLGFIAEDAIFLVAGRPPFKKQAFADGFRAALEQVRIEAHAEIEDLQIEGSLAYLRNHLQVTVTPRGGGVPIKRTGYTLTILRKQQDGRWVLLRDANLLTSDPSH